MDERNAIGRAEDQCSIDQEKEEPEGKTLSSENEKKEELPEEEKTEVDFHETAGDEDPQAEGPGVSESPGE